MDIHSQGGGIGFTVECVKRASEDELYRSLVDHLWMMLRKGTTLVEAKSGYGLDLENEVVVHSSIIGVVLMCLVLCGLTLPG